MDGSDLLSLYLRRIGLPDAPPRDASGIARMLQAHRQTIAFENLDIMLGRPIRIESETVFDKLVRGGRGGYCFEQNRLFSDMLAAIGLKNRPLLARVRLGQPSDFTPPRTHVLLLVELSDGLRIADAGFGGSYVPPLPLRDGAEAATDDGARHRLRRIGAIGLLSGEWLLERAGPAGATDGRGQVHGDWQPQYTFDLAEVAQDDLAQANHWTCTRPDTRFTSLHIASIALTDGFASMTDRQLSIWRDGATQVREIADAAEYGGVLCDVFGLELSQQEISRLPLFA